jgi:protein-disulfide isomerase-like protein with CxxC motif
MTAELFFIYDSHCPWSYATTPLVSAFKTSFPDITINLWHCAYFSDAESNSIITQQQIKQVKAQSNVNFSPKYIEKIAVIKDSTLCANLMTWANAKAPGQALALLNSIQSAHFGEGNALNSEEALKDIIAEHKLSTPAKVFNAKKLTSDAAAQVHEVYALQEIIETQAIPALLLAINDNLILLDHSLYLQNSEGFIDAINTELTKGVCY